MRKVWNLKIFKSVLRTGLISVLLTSSLSAAQQQDYGENRLDKETCEIIRGVLIRHPDFGIVSQNIKIVAKAQIVNLLGSVPSESDKQGIIKLAKSVAPAIYRVYGNNITVKEEDT